MSPGTTKIGTIRVDDRTAPPQTSCRLEQRSPVSRPPMTQTFLQKPESSHVAQESDSTADAELVGEVCSSRGFGENRGFQFQSD